MGACLPHVPYRARSAHIVAAYDTLETRKLLGRGDDVIGEGRVVCRSPRGIDTPVVVPIATGITAFTVDHRRCTTAPSSVI